MNVIIQNKHKMPTTYNEFQDKQEGFFEYSEIAEFHAFFVPLFYIDTLDISNSSDPLNLYGADRATSDNIDALRVKITEDCDSCPGQLLSFMFEDEDHDIHEALVAMIRKYKDLGNSVRIAADSGDSD